LRRKEKEERSRYRLQPSGFIKEGGGRHHFINKRGEEFIHSSIWKKNSGLIPSLLYSEGGKGVRDSLPKEERREGSSPFSGEEKRKKKEAPRSAWVSTFNLAYSQIRKKRRASFEKEKKEKAVHHAKKTL